MSSEGPATLDTQRLNRPGRRVGLVVKALADLVGALLLLVVLSPVLIVCAVAIKLDSPGSVLFVQKRLGLKGTLFGICKFRTMVPNAAKLGTGLQTREGDPRITRVGAILRKYRLDELPQLINVVKGEMSLVGPRPLVPDFLEGYAEADKQRLLMKQGMTGWQQVNGAGTHTWAQRIKADMWYIEHWSLWLDLVILLRTIAVVLRADTVYGKDGWESSGIPTALAPQDADSDTSTEENERP